VIVVLNGAPRSGKSSLAAAIQETFPGVWVNLGVDAQILALPSHLRPGIGLRPGAERPDVEPLIPSLYAALYGSALAYDLEGLDVVVDVGHHSRPGVLAACARLVAGRAAYLIGVRCPLDEIVRRRKATGFPTTDAPLALWQTEVHRPGVYDLEVDTSVLSPFEAAEAVRGRIAEPPAAFRRLADETSGILPSLWS
jgi:chloramphenicol 3-O phosphotransferase